MEVRSSKAQLCSVSILFPHCLLHSPLSVQAAETRQLKSSTGRSMDSRLFDAIRTSNTARIKELVEEDPDILFTETPEGNTALHLAVRFRWRSSAKKIFDICPISLITSHNASGQTPLHLAALGHNLSAVIMLASKFANDDVRLKEMLRMTDSNGDTAFHLALRENYENVASKLIDLDGQGLSNMINNKSESPLYLAASRRLSRIVKRLLEFSPSNYRGPPGNRTALHAAAAQGDTDTAMELLHLDKVADGTGLIPLQHAAILWNSAVAKLLLKHDPSTAYYEDRYGNKAIHMAALQDNIHTFREIYAFCPDSADAVNEKGENILHCAVKSRSDNVALEIARTAELRRLINQQDNCGNTPLHTSILESKFNCSFRLFLKKRAFDLGIINDDGDSAYDLFYKSKVNLPPHQLDLFEDFFKDSWAIKQCNNRSTNTSSYYEISEEEATHGKIREEKLMETRQRYAANVSLVATIMATITFAAAFTMPGGYSSENGKAVLFRNTALKVFLISDTVSMCCSLLVAYLFSSSNFLESPAIFYENYAKFASVLLQISFIGMLVAFATGMYAVVAPNCLWLGILICVMCAILPFVSHFIDNFVSFMVW